MWIFIKQKEDSYLHMFKRQRDPNRSHKLLRKRPLTPRPPEHVYYHVITFCGTSFTICARNMILRLIWLRFMRLWDRWRPWSFNSLLTGKTELIPTISTCHKNMPTMLVPIDATWEGGNSFTNCMSKNIASAMENGTSIWAVYQLWVRQLIQCLL